MPQRIPRYIGNHIAGAYIITVFALALSLAIILWLYRDQAIKLEKQTTKTEELAKQSFQLGLEIQQQRRITIFQSCREQNNRNAGLVAFLNKQGVTNKEQPLVYEFVDKLAPKRNCRLLVVKSTNSG